MGLTITPEVASDEWRVAGDPSPRFGANEWRVARKNEKLGGNADVCENKGVAKKAIRKYMKTQGMEIDGWEGAIHKLLKTKESGKRRSYTQNDR